MCTELCVVASAMNIVSILAHINNCVLFPPTHWMYLASLMKDGYSKIGTVTPMGNLESPAHLEPNAQLWRGCQYGDNQEFH